MRRVLRLFLVAILAAFCVSGNSFAASGIELVSIEPSSAATDKIELNEAPSGYNFSATFLDSNLELTYDAVIKNTTSSDITVDSIDFSGSTYDFLEYAYDGIAVGDTLSASETRSITLSIKTNDEDKQSISEDFNLSFTYSYTADDSVNPPTVDIIAGVAVAAIIFGAVAFILIKRNPRRAKVAILAFALIPSLALISLNAHAATGTFTIKGKVNFVRVFTMMIDPNGGEYDGHTEPYEIEVREGESIHLGTPTHEDLDFVQWEVNPSDAIDDENNVTPYSNVIIKVIWDEEYYKLTINTRDGYYKGVPGILKISYRPGEVVDLDTPTKTGYDFDYWTDIDEVRYDENAVTMNSDFTVNANYKDKYLTVTVNPNGGTFNGSAETTTLSVKYGDSVNLSNIARRSYSFVNWTMTGGATTGESSYTIKRNMEFTANWERLSEFTVSVDPNGGIYEGKTDPTTYAIEADGTLALGENPTRDGYIFDGWELEDGSILEGNEVEVTGDMDLVAKWSLIVARIDDTFYSSIMKAEAVAVDGDTIELLIDTSEEVTNTKHVTLDLGGHKVVGFIHNTSEGDLTLVNGTIENPDGAAVTNGGTFTMGIDDLKDDDTSHVENDSVILIGTDVGLRQNNIFYFYDGYIEGDLALVGGYDGSPYYRNTFDDTVVYYFPFVDHNYEKDCQRVQLESSDRAVTKTSVHGDIYYYNVQDNIDVSAITGYKIYAVRSFDASYPLTVNEGDEIEFDLVGYNVHLGDVVTINGKLTVTDQKNNVGNLINSSTITNNGTLTVIDAKISEITANTLLNNKKDLVLSNATLTSSNGYTVYEVTNGGTITMDDDSYIISTSTSNPAVYNTSNDLLISGGHILASYQGVHNNAGSFTISGGDVKVVANSSQSSSNNRYFTAIYNTGGTVTINGGEVIAENMKGGYTHGTVVTGSGWTRMNGGSIIVSTNNAGTAYGVYNYNGGGNGKYTNGQIVIKNTGTSGYTYGISGGKNEIDYASIKVSSDGYSANGIYSGTNTIKDIYIEAISAATSSSWRGVGIESGINTITGGKIYGSHYGIYGSTSYTNYIGINDGEIDIESPRIEGGLYGIYGGNNNFYDGVLIGGTAGYYTDSIKAIPDGTLYHIETIDGKENVWLEEGENYLEVNSVQYNSFTKAYNAITGDTGTIKVIASVTTPAELPTIAAGKNITLDLNSHTINYYQTLNNAGALTIVDNSAEKNGVLNNVDNTKTKATIKNTGTLTVSSGKVNGRYEALYNTNTGTVNINGGVVSVSTADSSYRVTITAIYNAGGTLKIFGGEVKANITYTGSDSYYTIYTSGGTINMSGGKVSMNSTATSSSAGIYNYSGSATNTFTGGEIDVEAAKGNIYGLYNGKNTISGLKINVHSAERDAYGIYSGTNVINDTEITAVYDGTSTSWRGAGISSGTNTILGGKIYGSQYGLYSGTNTIGANDGELNIESPEIIGGLYGIYGGTNNFYDGVLKGETYAYNDNSIESVATETKIYHDTDVIDGEEYHADYLVEATEYIEIDGTGYKSLQTAINEAEDGDVLVLTDSALNLDTITIPAGKNIVIDLAGNHIQTFKPITNNGTVKIIDSSEDKTGYLQYSRTANSDDYLITNNAIMEIDGIKIQAPYVVKNTANADIDMLNTTITSTNTAFYNLGEADLNNMNITSRNYAIYSSSKKPVTITNSQLQATTNTIYINSAEGNVDISGNTLDGYIYNSSKAITSFDDNALTGYINNNSGTFNISSSTIVRETKDSTYENAVSNSGTMSINDSSIALQVKGTRTSYVYGVNNSNVNAVLNISGDTTITIKDEASHTFSTGYGIYNSGTATLEKVNINVDGTSNYYATTYGIYNNSNSVVLKTGTVYSTGRAAYGIYVNNGEVTMGVPEVVGSPTYGRDTADVSLTDPFVYAVGTTTNQSYTPSGIGVKNIQGKFNYYDGKIMGSTQAKPEIPTKIEYLYEAIDYVDEETGHPYCILEWMRTQP